MGTSRWTASTYNATSCGYRTKSARELFSSRIKDEYNPAKITMRESRDSEVNPKSTPIIIGLDVTGSMGFIAEDIAKNSLGRLVENVLDNQPITDPHFMFMAIGDIFGDTAPLQVTQFEADIRIAEQLTGLWLEGGGCGNGMESYDLPWLFAARKTDIDSMNKRGKKGYLFTIGDEGVPHAGSEKDLNNFLGVGLESDISSNQMLEEAQEKYHVFHLIIEEGHFARRNPEKVVGQWRELLGKRAIPVNNYLFIPEIINAIISVSEGYDLESTIAQFENHKAQAAIRYSLENVAA